DALRIGATRVSAVPGRVDDPAPAGVVVESLRLAIDLVHFPCFHRADDVQAVADLATTGQGEAPGLTVAHLGDAGGRIRLEALGLAVEHVVRHACQGGRAIGRGSTAGHHVDTADQ